MEIIKAGTRVIFGANAGQVGTDAYEFYVLTSDWPERQLSDEAWQFALTNAEMYGIYNRGDYSDEEIDGDDDSYSDSIDGWFEIYDPEQHDGFRVGGDTNFTEL